MATRIAAVLLPALFALGFSGGTHSITIKGSDTMVLLTQRWAELYMQRNPRVVIQVTGGGSGTGISGLINGTTDICNSSRPMKNSERAKLKRRYNTAGVEIKCAKDGLSVYLNSANPLRELTLAQLRGIYSGTITNWKQLGGKDSRITVYGRENSSGTYIFFRDFVLLGNDFLPAMQTLPGTAAVVNAVSQDIYAIGFGGGAFGKRIKEAAIKETDSSPAVAPTPENIKQGIYPITRFLYMYILRQPQGELKKFIDWVLSAEGQSIVTEAGYYPVKH